MEMNKNFMKYINPVYDETNYHLCPFIEGAEENQYANCTANKHGLYYVVFGLIARLLIGYLKIYTTSINQYMENRRVILDFLENGFIDCFGSQMITPSSSE